MPIPVQNFRPLSAEELSPFGNLLPRIIQGYSDLTKAQYLPKEKAEALKQAIANSTIKQAQADVAPQMEAAKLATEQTYPDYYKALAQNTLATANKTNVMTPLEAINQKNINDWYAREAQGRINAQNAMANWRNMGGGGGGTGQKEEMFYQNLIAKDNPQLKTPEQIYEAANVLRSGGNQLSDGTQLNPLSPAARESLNRLTKGGTFAGAAVPLLKANQAEAELKVLNEESQKDMAPYATTYFGRNPDEIMDSFKSDNESQDRLGDFIASQAAQYEIAQIRNRLAGGEPGITATEELMKQSKQLIDASYPRLSARARQRAVAKLDTYLEKGLQARKSIGVGASSITFNNPNDAFNKVSPTNNKSSGKKWVYNQSTGQLEEKK